MRSDKINDEELLSKLKLLCDKLGRKPTGDEIDNSELTPSTSPYRRSFGTVNNAIKLVRPDLAVKGKRYSKQSILNEITYVANKLNKTPTQIEFDKYTRIIKCGTIKQYYGWNNLLNELGYELNIKYYNKQELIDKIKFLAKRINSIPSLEDLTKYEDMPSSSVFYREFGSWNKALKVAGFPTSKNEYIANDGHRCDSKSEVRIDNMLTKLGVSHTRDVHYPQESEFNPKRLLRCDWKVGDIYVEYFGNIKHTNQVIREAYNKKVERKKLLCKKLGLKTMFLYPDKLNIENQFKYLTKKVTKSEKYENLELLKQFCFKLGRRPSWKEINREPGFPSTEWYKRHFGSMSVLLDEIAGRGTLTLEDLQERYKQLKLKFGRNPKRAEMSYTMRLETKFVKWFKFVELMGDKPVRNNYSKEELLNILCEYVIKNQKMPSATVIKRPNSRVFQNAFGSWSNATNLCLEMLS